LDKPVTFPRASDVVPEGAAAESAGVDDSELLRRIGDGDPRALAALYDRYAAVLLAVAIRIVREHAEAEDIVHDAFVQVGDRAGSYVTERGSVSAWLVTMTRNLSIDRKRRRDRRGAIQTNVLAHEPQADDGRTADPESQVLGATEWRRVHAALSALPALQRTTLELAFFAGLSYPEIAEIENVPLGTIKSRAARALQTLRDALEKGGR
jgi:RNA polymerase sigma-70 factor, ECF subfamily